MINRNLIFLVWFCLLFFISCSNSWTYRVKPIIVNYKGKESVLYSKVYEKYSKFNEGIFASEICVLFENSMINTNVLVFNSERGKLFNFNIESKNKNNVSKLIFLPNVSTDLLIKLDNSTYFLKENTYCKYTFLVIKKRNDKFILTFTNKINYNLTNQQLKYNSENTTSN